MHVAAELGHTELLAYVAQQAGVRLNEVDKRGRTAMHMAVQMAQQQCMFLLLELGGLELAEQADKEGITPLQLAAKMGHIQVLKTGAAVAVPFPPDAQRSLNVVPSARAKEISRPLAAHPMHHITRAYMGFPAARRGVSRWSFLTNPTSALARAGHQGAAAGGVQPPRRRPRGQHAAPPRRQGRRRRRHARARGRAGAYPLTFLSPFPHLTHHASQAHLETPPPLSPRSSPPPPP